MTTSPNAAGRIVVGVDGSEASAAALRWAADEGRRRGIGLHVVTCWSYPTFIGGPFQPPLSGDDFARGAFDLAETEVATVLGFDPPVEVAIEVLEGAPSLRLLEFAPIGEMLVVGARGRGGFTGLLLGSVSQHLAEHARCPVVIIHPHDRV